MPYDSYRNLLEVISHVAQAEHELRNYMSLAGYEYEKWGMLPMRIGSRVEHLPRVAMMLQATFRLLKHCQFGDDSNLRQASELWVAAAAALLDERVQPLGKP